MQKIALTFFMNLIGFISSRFYFSSTEAKAEFDLLLLPINAHIPALYLAELGIDQLL